MRGHGLTAELEIGFINQEGGVGSCFPNLCEIGKRRECSGWIIRICHCNEPSAAGDCGQDISNREAEVLTSWNRDHSGASRGGINLVHCKSGDHYQSFVAGPEVCFADQVNGFVGSIGEQHFFGRDAESGSYSPFPGLTNRIASKRISIQFAQLLQNTRRTTGGVFVEIQSQAVAMAERRMVLLQRAHRVSRFKHLGTSRGWNRHALAGPRFQRGQ